MPTVLLTLGAISCDGYTKSLLSAQECKATLRTAAGGSLPRRRQQSVSNARVWHCNDLGAAGVRWLHEDQA